MEINDFGSRLGPMGTIWRVLLVRGLQEEDLKGKGGAGLLGQLKQIAPITFLKEATWGSFPSGSCARRRVKPAPILACPKRARKNKWLFF